MYRVEINDWPKLWPYIWNNLFSWHHFSVTKGFLDMIHLYFNPRKVNFSDYGWARGAVSKTQKSEIILQYGKLGSPTSMRRWFRNHYPNIPNSRILSVRTFSRLIQRFTDTISTEKGKNFWSQSWNNDREKHWDDSSNDWRWLSLIFVPL